MPIPQSAVDQLLAACGRRCCLCRRFQPLRLQVHHIQPEAEGGTDEPDNLIALCLNCHSSVHTKAAMARNFTFDELRLHRDNTITAVREGRLVEGAETPSEFREMLLPEAVEVLVIAAKSGGTLQSVEFDGGWVLQCGQSQFGGDANDHRTPAKYRKAFDQLDRAGLVEQVRDTLWQVTDDGYLLADQLITATTIRSDG